jgi:hypothetical protein
MSGETTILEELAFGSELDAYRGDPQLACLDGFLAGLAAAIRRAVADDRRARDLLFPACVHELSPWTLHMAHELARCAAAGVGPRAPDAFAMGRRWGRARLQVTSAAQVEWLGWLAVQAWVPAHWRAGSAHRVLSQLPSLLPAHLELLRELPTVLFGADLLPELYRLGLAADGVPSRLGQQLQALLRAPEPLPEGFCPSWEAAPAH